jgi:conjugative relaxase-like TrwC/TraI family protein
MMSTHKLTAGDGYLYLIRQTAAHDAEKRGRATLGDYYTEKGETPGRWVGRGLSAFGEPTSRALLTDLENTLWHIEAGSQVTEDQMKALFGLGLHPNAGAIAEYLISMGASKAGAKEAVSLGRPFVINDASTELQRRLAVAYRDHNLSNSLPWNAPIDETLRARMRTTIARDMFAAEYARGPADERELTGFIATQSRDQTTSTAGYDETFSPVKSFSVLWALAPIDVSKVLEQCHEQAVADTLEYLQDNAAFSRMGAQGVAQIDTDGFIAAQFTHRDSRAGDPDLHTHVAVSNKVYARGPDGIARWLALDGRPLFKGTVAASEFYNTRLEALAAERAGLVFEERPATQRGKRPVREIVGIPTDLCDVFSSRRAMIKDRYTVLAKHFQTTHRREPTTVEAIALHQRATLETRAAKHEPRSLAEQRQQWRTQAIEYLGSQQALSAMLVGVRAPKRRDVAEITDEWINEQARLVVDTVAASRSSWQHTHIYAEAQRRVRAAGWATERSLADVITAAALSEPLSRSHARVSDSDLGEPAVLRRRDGASIYTTHGTALFTSSEILSAEKRVLDAAGRFDGRRAPASTVEMALLEQKATRGRTLNPGQQAVVREMACSGARVQLALAPAGSGKTTAMAALTRAWEESGGRVLGLSPGANQAQLLRDDINTDTDTVDKFIWLQHHPESVDDPARAWFDAISDSTLIIVDEAGKAGTLQLDAVITAALARGASVRLVGDDQQLASVSAGGVLRDIDVTYGALNLTEVVRFKSRAEAQAGLALRDGDPTGLAFYADNHRIHVGSDDTIIDMVYQRWAADRARGYDTTMLAPTNPIVAQLNERARLDRLEAAATQHASSGGGAHNSRETNLSDGLRASVGDIVATRRNKRHLRIAGGRDFVRNGYRWRVEKVSRNGGMTVARLDTGQKATLPAWYVHNYVTLGYASTIDAAQGMTIGNKTTTGTCYVVGSEALSRQQLYTAMTRATDESHVFLSTAETDAHRILTPKATHPNTAIDVLERVLARDGAQVSATTEQRNAEDPFLRLGQSARMYVNAIGALAENRMGSTAMAAIDAGANSIYPNLTSMGAWPTLRMHLAILAVSGDDPMQRLSAAAATRELHTAADPAAVLDWRLDGSGAHSAVAGPLRWLPAIPAALTDNPDWAAFLHARHDLVHTLAESIRQTAATWDASTAPRWARPLLTGTPGIRAEIAVFRAAHDVAEPDTRLTGPEQYAVRDRKIQKLLDQLAEQHLGRRDPDTSRFHTLVDGIDTRLRRDPYWPQLATHLAQVARTDVNLPQLLTDAASDGPLPDQMPAAALWWRLAGRLQPAALETPAHHLRPNWLADLHRVFGTAIGETIAADPAFPRLVAAIDNADPDRWTSLDLLHVAHEHLRDIDEHHDLPLRPDEYARLLTYSIDLFASDNPYDHHDIPVPNDAPLTPEEDEALRHQIPDPNNPIHAPSNDATLASFPRKTGPEATQNSALRRTGSTLIRPVLGDALPPDPLDYDTHSDDEESLTFEDLLTQRPLTRPVAPAVANVMALRAEHHASVEELLDLQHQIANLQGPAVIAAADDLLALRQRAEQDRPYMLAVQDVLARWSDAETRYEQALSYVQYSRDQLAELQADPQADPLDLASARAGVRLAMLTLPDITPAERFRDELSDALARRAAAAGGADQIVSGEDVEAARERVISDDFAALGAARTRRDRLAQALARAETAAALAFAEAETRSADHILDHIDDLHTELDMLRAAGDYQLERGFTIPHEATKHLPELTARTIIATAQTGFTVTALHAEDDNAALAAMSVLNDAATANDHQIVWCTPTDARAELLRGAGFTDTVLSLTDVHEQIAHGQRQLSSSTTIVVDRAATADPAVLTDLAEHASEHHARLLLVDGHDDGWPPAPSGPLLNLLQQDLPWSGVLSIKDRTPARRVHQPDRDPVLEQADRCNPDILPAEITEALQERRRLRTAHDTSHRVHSEIWRQISTTPGHDHDTSIER